MDHPNILKINEYYQDDQFHYFISDYCIGDDFFPRIK